MQWLRRVLRKALRIGLITTGILLLCTVLALAGLFLVGRSHWGQQKLLAALLPLTRNTFTGELRIRELSTDLTHMLVLRGVELTDAEGQVAVAAERIGLRYNLLALLIRKVSITAMHVEGASVHGRRLHDGRHNLSRLIRPSDKPPSNAPLPVTVQVDGIVLDAQALDEWLAPPLGPARAAVHVEGEVTVAAGAPLSLEVQVDKLLVATSDPLRAELSAAGGLSLGARGLLVRDVKWQLNTAGEQVSRAVPEAALRGPLRLHGEVGGSLAELTATALLELPQGRALLKGAVGVSTTGLPWHGTLELRDVGLQAVRADLPDAVVQLELGASGEGPRAQVLLRRLAVTGYSAQVSASGTVAADLQNLDPRAAEADLTLDVAAAQLGRLQALGIPKAQGEAKVHGRLQVHQRKVLVDLDVAGKDLGVAEARVRKLRLQLHSADLLAAQGQLALDAEQLVLGGLPLDHLSGRVQGSPAQLSAQLSGRGPAAVEFAIDVDAKPTLAELQLQALSAHIKTLRLRKGEAELRLTQPAHVALSLTGPAAPVVVASDVHAALDEQRLDASGRYEGGTQKIEAKLDALAIDARKWLVLLGVTAPVPTTKLDAHVELRGPLQALQGKLRLQGSTQPLAEPRLPPSTITLAASCANRRVAGESVLFFGAETAESRPKVEAHFDLPLALSGPVSVEVTANAGVDQLTDYLPPALKELRGALGLSAVLKGKVERPEVRVALTAPQWQLGDFHGAATTAELSYHGDNQQLGLVLGGRLQDAAGTALGTLSASAQTRLRSRPETHLGTLVSELRTAPLSGQVQLSGLAVPELLRLVSPDKEPPLQAGVLNAGLTISGTALAPALAVQARALGCKAGRLRELEVALSGGYTGTELHLVVDASLGQTPLLHASGGTRLEFARLPTAPPDFWRALPLSAQVDLLPFDLHRLSRLLAGEVKAQLLIKGTPAAPEATAKIQASGVQVDTWQVGSLSADATLDVKRQLEAALLIHQQQPAAPAAAPAATSAAPAAPGDAGTLSVRASIPLSAPPSGPAPAPQLSLRANRFRIDYAPGTPPQGSDPEDETAIELVLAELRRARATLDADARIELGPVASLQGFVKVSDGAFYHKALAQELRELNLELQLQPGGRMKLVQLAAKAGDGTVRVEGSGRFDGPILAEGELDLNAKGFPVAAGSFAGWLDTHVRVKAKSHDKELAVDVTVPAGTLRLPKLSSSHEVQSLDPLSDVTFVDRAARAQAARLRARQQAELRARAEEARHSRPPPPFLPPQINISVQLPGAFSVAGPEVKTDLQGSLAVAIIPGSAGGPVVNGVLSGLGGWVEVLNRRYQITRATVSLAGEQPPNPLLDVVISRQLESATISILVSGTARSPKVSFRSDPPLYDESQIIAIILGGEGGGSISSQALGALSSLIVGQIKDQLGSLLPVDVIKFDVGGGGNDPMGIGSSSLEIGKYLRDDLYFSYMHRFNAAIGLRRINIDQVRLEYRFLSRFQLTTRYGDANVGSLDLFWTKRF